MSLSDARNLKTSELRKNFDQSFFSDKNEILDRSDANEKANEKKFIKISLSRKSLGNITAQQVISHDNEYELLFRFEYQVNKTAKEMAKSLEIHYPAIKIIKSGLNIFRDNSLEGNI